MICNLRRPCGPACPFRSDQIAFLRLGHAIEIAASLLTGETFSCHKTFEYEEDENGFSRPHMLETTQQCAGATIMLLHEGKWNMAMQLASRLFDPGEVGYFDPEVMDMSAPVFRTAVAFVAHHGDVTELDAERLIAEAIERKRRHPNVRIEHDE